MGKINQFNWNRNYGFCLNKCKLVSYSEHANGFRESSKENALTHFSMCKHKKVIGDSKIVKFLKSKL